MIGGKMESHGFTIIEVIIVLAIAALIFISAGNIFYGRQGEATFDQSINQVQAVLQQQVNDVANGYYPNGNSFSCSAASSGAVSLSTVSNNLGTNSGCVFAGKVINFVSSSTPNQFAIYPLVGRQCAANFIVSQTCPFATTILESQPILLASSPSHTTYPDDTVWSPLEGGLQFNAGQSHSSACTPAKDFGAIAFMSNPSNTQDVNAYAICSSPYGTYPNNGSQVDTLDSLILNQSPDNNLSFCLYSASSNESGLLTITNGGGQGQLQVNLKNSVGNTTCT